MYVYILNIYIYIYIYIYTLCTNIRFHIYSLAYICTCYVPALALQVAIYSCTRQKGRKDSDGRVQDVR